MKFKNILIATMMVLATTLSMESYAATGPAKPSRVPAESTNPEVQRMMNRLEEIRAMDLDNIPRSEKRKYAKEVKQIEKRMKAVGGGVYISAGALIIIVLLLILIL